MNRTLARRLETLEERVIPDEEPSVMEVVFIDAATKQPTGRLELKLGVPEQSRSRTLYR
jgi:hypothetical protein